MRGQAAMELLMTYGWMILALLVVITALAKAAFYFANEQPDSCMLQPGIGCAEYDVAEKQLKLVPFNNLPSTFSWATITLDTDDCAGALVHDAGGTDCGLGCANITGPLRPNKRFLKGAVIFNCTGILERRVEARITVEAMPEDGVLPHVAQGHLRGSP